MIFWRNVARCAHLPYCPYCCWDWQGFLYKGYGHFKRQRKVFLAPRLAWEFFHQQPFPVKRLACHWCHRPSCCNPLHLFPGTPKENTQHSMRDKRLSHGARNHNAKLTEALIGEILTLYSQGYGCADLAKLFPVSDSTIRFIVERKTWKHVSAPAGYIFEKRPNRGENYYRRKRAAPLVGRRSVTMRRRPWRWRQHHLRPRSWRHTR
jgi:hypothetical protein